jgi:hypothetical protein
MLILCVYQVAITALPPDADIVLKLHSSVYLRRGPGDVDGHRGHRARLSESVHEDQAQNRLKGLKALTRRGRSPTMALVAPGEPARLRESVAPNTPRLTGARAVWSRCEPSRPGRRIETSGRDVRTSLCPERVDRIRTVLLTSRRPDRTLSEGLNTAHGPRALNMKTLDRQEPTTLVAGQDGRAVGECPPDTCRAAISPCWLRKEDSPGS